MDPATTIVIAVRATTIMMLDVVMTGLRSELSATHAVALGMSMLCRGLISNQA